MSDWSNEETALCYSKFENDARDILTKMTKSAILTGGDEFDARDKFINEFQLFVENKIKNENMDLNYKDIDYLEIFDVMKCEMNSVKIVINAECGEEETIVALDKKGAVAKIVDYMEDYLDDLKVKVCNSKNKVIKPPYKDYDMLKWAAECAVNPVADKLEEKSNIHVMQKGDVVFAINAENFFSHKQEVKEAQTPSMF